MLSRIVHHLTYIPPQSDDSLHHPERHVEIDCDSGGVILEGEALIYDPRLQVLTVMLPDSNRLSWTSHERRGGKRETRCDV